MGAGKVTTTSGVLYYGENLKILRDRRKISDDSVDLCYIDPPFNSQRSYNQIYNNIGSEDRAQTQAFVDTWIWDNHAMAGFVEILANERGRFSGALTDLIKGLHVVLGEGSLLAYLVSMSLRVTEIRRVLKPSGSFYLHCDPTASHYLKIILDAIFCAAGGNFQNEIIWRRTGSHNAKRSFGPIHDVVLFYTKSTSAYVFNIVRRPYMKGHVETRYTRQSDGRLKFTSGGNVLTGAEQRDGDSGKAWRGFDPTLKFRHWAIPKFYEAHMPPDYLKLSPLRKLEALYNEGLIEIDGTSEWPIMARYLSKRDGVSLQDIWAYQPYTDGTVYGSSDGIDIDVAWHGPTDSARLGYPTQKPEGLLERIIKTSTNEGDLVLDAYCGCGTTVAVAQKLNRRWIGMDIAYQSIAVVLRRFEYQFGKKVLENIVTDGIPRDMKSAEALACKRDDRLRKEFEKWAVLTYTNNRAVINEKKGADGGIVAIAYFMTGKKDNAKIIFQVKSGSVKRSDIATLRGDMTREKAALAVLITLEEPSKPMINEAKSAGQFRHETMGRTYDCISIVTVREIIESGARLEIPMIMEVLAAVKRKDVAEQKACSDKVA
jgi:DNA modification methylase